MLTTCARWCYLLAAVILHSSLALADSASDKFGQGVAALKKKDFDRAIACFDEAIRLDPKNADAYYNRGQAYLAKNDYGKAISDFTEVLRLKPKDSDAYFGRGYAYKERGLSKDSSPDYAKAIADFTEAILLDPKATNAYYNRGQLYALKKQSAKAIADFSALIRLNPNHSDHFFRRGELYLETKQYPKAVSDFTEVIRLDAKLDSKGPNLFNKASGYTGRGHAYAGQRDYEKAIGDYQEALRINPDFTRGYDALAWLWATCPEAKVRDGKKALEYAKKACELAEDTDPDLFDTLAAAYAENGNFAEAVKWLKKGLESPDFTKDRREKALSRLKLYERAKAYRDE